MLLRRLGIATVGVTLGSLGYVQNAHAQRPSLAVDSPQHFAFEVRVGPYTPLVDEEPALGGKTPFKDVFGDKLRLAVGFEFDWQALRIPHLGTIGPGLAVSYTAMSATARVRGSTELSKEETSLQIWPIYGLAVLRVDVLARDLRIPIVPYAKGGVGWAGWRAYGPNGTANVDGVAGKGMSWGTHFALGAALQLDVFDRMAARSLDEATGINHTYVWFEYYMSLLDGFGSASTLRVGTRTWATGLAFEF
jgi:hypothetical protein